MSVADDKQGIFTTIGAYTSLNKQGKLPDLSKLYTSINNTKEIIPLLLDVLGILMGTEGVKIAIGKVFGSFTQKIEPKLKVSIKKQLIGHNADKPLPQSFINGISISLKSIDPYGKYKNCSNPKTSNLLFDNSAVVTFDNVIKSMLTTGAQVATYNNLIDIVFNPITDILVIKPHAPQGATIGSFIINFIDSLVIINQKELISNVMDAIYGTITANSNKTYNEVKDALTLDKIIQQVVENNDDSYTLNPKYINDINKNAQELSNGTITYDTGCGFTTATLDINDLTNIVSAISGSTDPFLIGNTLGASVNNAAKNNPSVTNENQQSINDNFFRKLLQALVLALAKSITLAPQIRTILAISSAFLNEGNSLIKEAKTDLKAFDTFIKCNSNEAMQMLIEFIYNLAITALMVLLKPIFKKIVKEQGDQYLLIIKSLVPVNI